MKLLGVNAGTTAVCRTIDVCDIFGDSSGKALYRLDGNANDESGNYHGTETAITYGGGVYERGAVFNGSSSKVTSAYSIPVNTFSFSCWVKFNTVGTRQPFGTATTAGGDGKFIFQKEASNTLLLGFNTVGKYLTSVATITSGIWYHMVGTCSSTGVYKLYINNILDTTSAAFGNNTAATFQLGFEGATSSYLNGSIDQVRIFNKEISISEVATLFAECAPTSIVDNINPFMDGSLKALYKFNGDATDATGVYNGTATNVTYGTGKFGQCAVFNGTSSYISSTAYPTLSTSFTYSVWVKANTLTAANQDIIDFTTGRASFVATGNGLGTTTVSYYDGTWRSFAYTLTIGVWTHLVLSIAGTTAKLYANGTLVSTITVTAVTPSGTFTIGAATSLAAWLNGSLDQLRIFNKALTPLEVASLYNETTPLEEPMYKLVDPFKDGSGKALYRLEGNALDESGNYDGTATSVTYGTGQFGRCGVFNGSSASIISGFTAPADSTYSYSVWVKTTVNTGTKVIMGDGTGSTATTRGAFGFDGTKFALFNGNGSTGWLDNSTLDISAYQDGNFHHIVITANGTTFKVYIDNVLKYTYTSSVPAGTAGSTPYYFGKLGSSASGYFNGSIDQIRVFDKELTAGEVSTLYTSEAIVLP